MEDSIQAILNSVGEKPARSRLEPYGELIDELRRRELTYREIARILTDKFEVRVPKSTLNDFVRARTRKRRNAARKLSRRLVLSTPLVLKQVPPNSTQERNDDEVRQRIAALRARKPVTAASAANYFHYNPDEPLRLINPGKRDPND